MLDCPVKPGHDTGQVNLMEKWSNRVAAAARLFVTQLRYRAISPAAFLCCSLYRSEVKEKRDGTRIETQLRMLR